MHLEQFLKKSLPDVIPLLKTVYLNKPKKAKKKIELCEKSIFEKKPKKDHNHKKKNSAKFCVCRFD